MRWSAKVGRSDGEFASEVNEPEAALFVEVRVPAADCRTKSAPTSDSVNKREQCFLLVLVWNALLPRASHAQSACIGQCICIPQEAGATLVAADVPPQLIPSTGAFAAYSFLLTIRPW